MSHSQCFINPEMCHLITFCCITWRKPIILIWNYTLVEITIIYTSILIFLKKFETIPVSVSPSSSYFNVLHFLNCFQSLSEKATWNGFLEMINMFSNAAPSCCWNYEVWGLAYIHFQAKRYRRATFEINIIKEMLGWESDRKVTVCWARLRFNALLL